MKADSIEQMIYDETEKRLEIMGKKDYEFPPKVTKIDAIGIIVAIVISLALIILCMIGVIN